MISTVSEFDEEIAWEKTILALSIPLMPLSASGADLDLRTGTISIGLSDSFGAGAVEELRNTLLPLLFGSSWKILDLSLELALAMARIVPDGTRWLISEKSQLALAHSGSLHGFAQNDLWQAYGSLYAGTQQLRHALVHRRVRVNSDTRELTGFDNDGNALQSMTYDEQVAFCRFAQRMAQVIVEGLLRPRVESDLRSQIAVLQRHHGVNVQAASVSRPPVRLIDNFPTNGQLDVPALLNQARTTFPGATYVDVLLHLDDGRTLLGELDSAPIQTETLDIAALPPWLRFA
jgi:hypothetical protein